MGKKLCHRRQLLLTVSDTYGNEKLTFAECESEERDKISAFNINNCLLLLLSLGEMKIIGNPSATKAACRQAKIEGVHCSIL